MITLYNMFTRADFQRSKQALRILLMNQEIISNVIAFLTKGAHTLEVLHRVHPSGLLMMHTCHKFCGVSSKKKSITGNTRSMFTQQLTLSWTGTPLVALADEKLILPLLTIDQSKMCKEHMNLPCVALFRAFVGAKETDFWGSKMQCSANDTNYQDDVRYLQKEGALGEAVRQAQVLTKPKKSFFASGGGKLLVNFNDSTTI